MGSGENLFQQTRTLVTAAFGNASAHTFNDLPAMYFSSAVKGFQHIPTSDVSACDLYLSILQELDGEIEGFGESTSTVSLV